MTDSMFCEYHFKAYLNANHRVIINGRQGEIHPHTWELMLNVLIPEDHFTEFQVYEKAIDEFISTYQNETLNEIAPFDFIVPTLENIVDLFGNEIRKRITALGGTLLRIEGSESPTRSYIISYERESDYLYGIANRKTELFEKAVDKMLDDILA